MMRDSSSPKIAGNALEQVARVRVARARPDDVGTGTARLGVGTFRRLGLAVGDLVELAGKRRTTAVTARLPFEDRGLDVVRIDGLVRANAGATIGEMVDVRRAAISDARSATLAVLDGAPLGSIAREAVRRTLLGRVVNTGDLVSTMCMDDGRGVAVPPAREIQLRVISTEPSGSVVVRVATDIDLRGETAAPTLLQRSGVTYDDVGGLADVIAQLREAVELPMSRPDLFRRLGIAPPRGVLLHGPSGSGKTLLAKAVAGEVGARLVVLDPSDVADTSSGTDLERTFAGLLRQTREQTPTIVLLDDLEAMAPARAAGGSDHRVTSQLIALINALESRYDVVLIGTTRAPDAVDEALRRPGRFDREISVRPLDHAGRREVLAIHSRHVPVAADIDLDELAAASLGFAGADVASLVREAAVATVRRTLAAGAAQPMDSALTLIDPLEVRREDFRDALTRVRPAAMREHPVEIPTVHWSDIGGLDDVKRALRDGIGLPLKHPEAFSRLGIRASRGYLLFGPPGTGKTLLAKAVAHEAAANFIVVRPSDLLSKWYGESERQVAELFARARRVAPAVLFFDEIEALVPRRGMNSGEPAVTERLVNAFLMEIDGLEQLRDVVVIGATNQPQLIDPALLRPGRIDELVYVPAPNDAERLHILQVVTARVPLGSDVDLRAIADRTAGYTGADLEGLVRRAGFRAFCENGDARHVQMAHFEYALRDSRPSVTPEIDREYELIFEVLRLPGGTRRGPIGFAPNARS